MKSLKMLVGIMLVSLTVFSQQTTPNTTKNKDTVITLPIPVAREVVKDLIKKDSLNNELIIAKNNIELYKGSLSIKDSIINSKNSIIDLYKQKESNYLTMLELKDLQKKNLNDLVSSLNKELKKKTRENRITKIASGVVVGFFGYLLLK